MALPAATLRDKAGRPFTVRRLLPEDRVQLERMYDAFEPKRVAQGLPPATAEQRRRWLDTILASGIHLVVEVDGRVAGHGMLIPFQPQGAELANFLHQSIRDCGIGTALNRTLLAAGREAGLARVWLSVEPSNRRAIRSYENVGFRPQFTSGWAPELEMEAQLRDEEP